MKRATLHALSRVVLVLLALLLLGLGVTACSDDDGTKPDTVAPKDGGGEAVIDADGGGTCTSFETEHEKLLNAPTNATVLHKTPTHPPVGSGGLP